MSRPEPQRGQVVRFEYLWASESFRGESEGEKPRPCAVVVTMKEEVGKPLQAMLCGITHTEPKAPSEGVKIPPEAKAALGLDDELSWVIISEVNTVDWTDRSRFFRTPSGLWTYGDMAREIMNDIRDRMVARIKAGTMDFVNRPDIDERTKRG